jgi:hypothetical protein
MIREKNFGELGEVLTAYLDGELTPDEMEQVEALLRKDESARRLLSELRVTVQAVSSLPRRQAPSSIVEEVQLRLERNELLDDLPAGPMQRPRLRMRWSGILSMAAMLGVVVIAGSWLLTDRPADVPIVNDLMLAQRGGDESGLVKREENLELERKSVDRPEVVASARRSTTEGIDQPEVLASRELHDDRAVRPARATRGSRAASPSDAATAAKAPNEFPRDETRLADVSAGTDGSIMRLQLSVSSDSERAALLSKLSGRYAAYQSAHTTSEYEHSKPEGMERLALRLPLAEVDTLLSTVDGKNGVSEMALTAGPLTVRGKDRIRDVLALALAPADSGSAEEVEADYGVEIGEASAADQSQPDQQAWRDLIRSLGIDPDTLALLLRPVDDKESVRTEPEDAVDEAAPLALRAQAENAPDDSLVARRLRAAKQLDAEPDPPVTANQAATAVATATVDVVIEISVNDSPRQPNEGKPAFRTRARLIKPSDAEKKRPTAQ